MAAFDVFNVETPQQVQARIHKGRAKQRAGSPNEVRVAGRESALDAIFGNKEVDAAQAVDTAIKAGMVSAETQFEEEGIEDPAQQQMLRLESVRKSVQDISPTMALKLEDQIRTLRIADLEKQKLTQTVRVGDHQIGKLNDRYLFNPETMKTEKVDIGTDEGKLRYDAAGEQGLARSDTEGGVLNLFNAAAGRKHSMEVARLERIAKAQEKAAEDEDDRGAITRTRRTQMQKIIEANTQLTDAYRRSAKLLQQGNLTSTEWANKVDNFTHSVKDLAGRGLTATEIKDYVRFQEIVQQSQGAANRLIKERSGAAVTEQEWERLKIELPTTGDSPVAFAKKTQVMYDIIMRSTRRLDAALQANDYQVTTQKGEGFALPEDSLFGNPSDQPRSYQPDADQPAPAASGGFKVISIK